LTLGVQDVSFTRADFGRWLPADCPSIRRPTRIDDGSQVFEGLGAGRSDES
jgi:hypothetical protein